MSKLSFTLLGLTLFGSPAIASEVRHAGAHVHGVNFVQMVLEGQTLEITYQLVAGQLDGAEKYGHHDHDHDHKHDDHKHDDHAEDHAKVERREAAIGQLENHEALFHLPSAANCARTGFEGVLQDVTENHHNHDADKEAHAGHQDAILQYTFTCQQPNNLNSIEFHAFETYGSQLEKIQIEGLIGSKAISSELTESAPELTW